MGYYDVHLNPNIAHLTSVVGVAIAVSFEYVCP